ncbi:MAG: hypothetical protein IPP57_02685 [Candidatus Obscuribacter sp.]|jgi:hypothetical protein|nr:hypothetical protein [Candidatus Obscuribacter sp.]MBK9202348.1 hypothetical protein [Candidatus Obscuribacter sp.]MBK9618855.1 hypothetical protein [Candidatus Obscuribacter sp.]MBK9769731.1 hypothetical protein [Candidatus Obscuribacter sp.]MBP6348639.1 hypothetical protein [Candidatus Obscuribacter sp.]
MTQMDLNAWFKRIQGAKKRSEVFAILDEFRPLPWSDEERSQIAKLYIRLLDLLPEESGSVAPVAATPDKPANDGPVWYEKM